MKKYLIGLTILLLSFCVACQFSNKEVVGSGKVVKEDREITSFSNIRFSGIGSLYIAQGDKPALTIEAEDNIIPEIKTTVDDDTLNIEAKRKQSWFIRPKKPVKFILTVNKIDSIKIFGTGSIIGEGTWNIDDLEIVISGAGDARAHIKGKSLNAAISGAGDFHISGEVINQSINISGSGDYNAAGLVSEQCRVAVSGSGDATVNVKDLLEITVSGLGTVNYFGDPKITQEISGLGTITQLER